MSKQTVGYKYFAGLQIALGNVIEQIKNINADNRGWIFTSQEEIEQLKNGDTSIAINKPDLFGGDKQEGGWVGTIDIHTGRPENLRQNEYLAEHDSELVSSFPFLSHVVYRGNTLDKGFQLVSMSGMLKEVLYWVKRTRIKNDGSEQWYKTYIRDNKEVVVCEIGTASDLSISEYQNRIDNLPPLLNEWFGTDNQDNQFHKFLDGNNNPVTGLIDGYTWNFRPQFGYIGKTGYIKTTFPDALLGLCIKLTVWADDGISGFMWSGGEYVLLREFSEEGFITCRDYILLCEMSPLHLQFGVTDGIPAGTNSGHRVNILSSLPVAEDAIQYLISGQDLNPIHKIREILTDDTAMNKPESDVNDDNFKLAANRIWDEGLGISWAITEKSCKQALDELLYHIEAGIRVNRQTGQYEVILFRDDLIDLGNAQVFNKSNIKSFNAEIANSDDLINSLNVNFYDRMNIKKSSFTVDENGMILSTGEQNIQSVDFPYFMNRRNAELVANWKLKQLSTPSWKGSFTTGKYEARKINRYDVIKITWPNLDIIDLPVRVMKISLGDGLDNTVTIDFIEVIPYSNIEYPKINVDQSTNTILPPQPNQSIVFEMPYFEAVQRFGQTQVDAELVNNPDLGYLVVATKRPQNNSINALLYTDDGTGYQQTSIVDYCPVAVLDQDIGYLDVSFAVKNIANISQAEIGTLILCDEELMVYQSYDTETKVLTVKRAALDTVPKPHSQDAVFYFYDAFNAFDSEQYVLSEVISAKVLTTTPSGVQDIDTANAMSLEINARAIRPYPPANVKINDEYYPDEIETDLVLTWVDRNRLQQTGGTALGWTDGGVALESGALTMLIIKELDSDDDVIATHSINATGTNTYTLTVSAMQAETRSIEVTAKTVRDVYDSYQYFQHTVELSTFFSAPYGIEYTVREV